MGPPKASKLRSSIFDPRGSKPDANPGRFSGRNPGLQPPQGRSLSSMDPFLRLPGPEGAFLPAAGPEVGKITDLRVGGWENHRPPGAKVGDFPSPLRGAVFRPWIRFHMFSYVFMLSGPEGEAMGGLSNLERRSPIHPYPFQNLSDGHNMAI